MTDKPAPSDLKPIQAQFRAAGSLLRRSQIQKPFVKSKPEIKKQDNKNTKPNIENNKSYPDRKNGATTPPESEKVAKSSAQVARLVAPNAGGLKPDDEFGPLSGDKTDDEAYGDDTEDEEYEIPDEHDWESIEQDQPDEKPDSRRAEELMLQRILAKEEWEPNRPAVRTRKRRRLKRWIPLSRRYEAEAERRPHPLGVRFSAFELEIVKAKAKMICCSVNSYIRAVALHSDYKPPRDPALIEVLRLYYREYRAQGNNLNQIAHRFNAGVIGRAEALTRFESYRQAAERTMKAILLKLGNGESEP